MVTLSNSDIEYQPDAKYARGTKDEWISIEQFLTKDRVLTLADIVGRIVSVMMVRGNIGENTAEELMRQIKELKEEIIRK